MLDVRSVQQVGGYRIGLGAEVLVIIISVTCM